MRTLYLWISFLCFFYFGFAQQASSTDKEALLPIGGNTWAIPPGIDMQALDNDSGTMNWTQKQVSFKTYFRLSVPQEISLWISVAKNMEQGRYEIQILDQKKIITLDKGVTKKQFVGKFNIEKPGYCEITLTALDSQKSPYAQVVAYYVGSDKLEDGYNWVKDNQGNMFYWGQRGPSVHLNYQVDTPNDIEYYYNEITVDKGQDVIGSYYMANGFDVGYFGIQVNSQDQRRVLFSVWSPYVTDNPGEIPAQDRILLQRKGPNVQTGEFGNEGSGGQSYLVYNWKAGLTYKFLLKAEPLQDSYTQYTAWFFAPELAQWQLIASFSRPKTNSYLKRFHSFLENFIPLQGDKSREVYFTNQWVRDTTGQWIPVTKAKFSADNTARIGFRMDYQGGVENGKFYLKNGGFFDNYTPIGQDFEVNYPLEKPQVNLQELP
ncbi:DUF3472 domain-containing protein [Myroides sp. LJL119]